MKKYKEWLTNEIEIMESETSENYPHEQMVEREVVLNLINQLDEPEVLSQEWIDKHEEHYEYIGYAVVPVDDLQNLILPKESPSVIPKYVAEWIEANREVYGNELLSIGYDLYNNAIHPEVDNWIIKNEQKFVRAWLDDYTVEKEQKYYALDNEYIPLLQKGHGYVNRTSTGLSIFEKERGKNQFALTEQEIKAYDERFWAFAVKVEELEK